MICDYYIDEMTYNGTRGKCMGTRECGPCSCNGDMSKCDFYEEVRNKGILNNGPIKNLNNLLAQYPEDLPVKVVIGNKIRPLSFITTGVDMDTNELSIWFVGEDNEM